MIRELPLPNESAPTLGRRGIVLSLLLPLLLVVGIDALIVSSQHTRNANTGYWLIQSKWRLLEELDAPVDTLLLGDSSCNQGLEPTAFERVLGGTALNLCTIGNALVAGDAWMLQRYLERFGPPSRVVLGHVYDVWPRDESALEPVLWNVEYASRGWRGKAPELERSAADDLSLWFHALVPLWSQPNTVREVLYDPAERMWRPSKGIDARGFMRRRKGRPDRVRRDVAGHLHALRRVRRTSWINDEALERMVALSTEHGFELWVTHAPVNDQLGRHRLFKRQIGVLNRYLLGHLDGAPHARLLRKQPSRFKAADMQNADHLIDRAAKRYSGRIAKAIRKAMSDASQLR